MKIKKPLCQKLLLAISVLLTLVEVRALSAQTVGEPIPEWTPGMLDIHEISTGRTSSTFFVLPDGTTLLYDAGDFTEVTQEWRIPRYLEISPNESRSPGEWTLRYIERVLDQSAIPNHQIDYAVPSHFHSDHMGQVTDNTPVSEERGYALSGFTLIGDQIPIKKMIDRAWPDYEYLIDPNNRTINNYKSFIEWQHNNNGLIAERFEPGHNNQIVLRNTPSDYPTFEVQNVAANGEVWTGVGSETRTHVPPLEDLEPDEYPSENISSIALRMSYGKFDYFTGGDIAGVLLDGQPSWFDIETPIAKAVGPVEVATLNHHGYYDAQNTFLVETLRPQAWIISVWDSSHPSPMVYRRLRSRNLYPGPRDIFATRLHEATRSVVAGMDQLASDRGHIVVRVDSGGDSFMVIILDDTNEEMIVKSVHGPYEAR
jgi:beta-lactamase superfamily II metal-dependent hydrolase